MNESTYKRQTIRHGEIMLVPINDIHGLDIEESGERIILAHSETGHHHIAVGDVVKYRPIAKGDPRYDEIMRSLSYAEGTHSRNLPTVQGEEYVRS